MNYDKLSELAKQIIAGEATIARLDTLEEHGRVAGSCRNVEATIVLGTAFGNNKSEQNGSFCPVNQESCKQKDVLKAYADNALQNGIKLWYSEVDIEEIIPIICLNQPKKHFVMC